MTTHPVFNRWLWGTMLATAFLIWIGLQCSSCGGAGPTRTMAKVVRATVEAQCADLDPVVECLEKIDKNAAAVDELLPEGGK